MVPDVPRQQVNAVSAQLETITTQLWDDWLPAQIEEQHRLRAAKRINNAVAQRQRVNVTDQL